MSRRAGAGRRAAGRSLLGRSVLGRSVLGLVLVAALVVTACGQRPLSAGSSGRTATPTQAATSDPTPPGSPDPTASRSGGVNQTPAGFTGTCAYELTIDGHTVTTPDVDPLEHGRILYRIVDGELDRVTIFGGSSMKTIGTVSDRARGFANPKGSDPITGPGTYQFGRASFDLTELGGKEYVDVPHSHEVQITAFDPPAEIAGIVTSAVRGVPFTLRFETTEAIHFSGSFWGC